MSRKKVAVLISGSGSNLQALIDAAKKPDYPAEISLVISNKPGAYGLTRAREAGIPTSVIEHHLFESREHFDRAMNEQLEANGTELVCLAGFMRLLSPWFVRQWRDRLVNIHPSLLPDYKGTHVHERVLAAGEKESGCTVHFVREEMDVGPIIKQMRVRVESGDTPETLAARVLEQEHICYPQALSWLASGKVTVRDERAFITA